MKIRNAWRSSIGLGQAFVKALLAAGATKVYVAARDPSSVTVAGVERIKLDVTNRDDVAAAARTCAYPGGPRRSET